MILAAAAIATPFLGVLLIAVGARAGASSRLAATLAQAAAAVSVVLVAWMWRVAPRPLAWRVDWFGAGNIGIGVYVDDLSLLFALLVTAISLLSLVYSRRYVAHEMAEQPNSGSGEHTYYAYMLLFTGAMLGMVFAVDLIPLYVFWELTGVASFLLIGLHWRVGEARQGAVKALIITSFGGLTMLLGFLALGTGVGSFALPAVLEPVEGFRYSALFSLALVLVVLGAATKSAQVPFHIWLPAAMVAPTPVSAFLHSAALVAAGVYLLARLHPLFAESSLWQWTVGGFGVASIFVGAILALRARAMKELLAYSTISQYGFMFALLSFASSSAVFAALFFFFHHAIIKAGLFLVAGSVMYATGTKMLGEARGRWKKLPFLFLFACVLAFSLAGVPPFGGFWMKEEFLKAMLETERPALVTLSVAASALTLAYMLRFLGGSFLSGTEAGETHPVPWSMLLVVGALAALTVLFGVLPNGPSQALVAPAARALVEEEVHAEIALHLDAKLALSLVALALGTMFFVRFRPRFTLLDGLASTVRSVEPLSTGIVAALTRVGEIVLRLQGGLLSRYVVLTLLGLGGLIGVALLAAGPLPLPPLQTTTGEWTRSLGTDVGFGIALLLLASGSVLTLLARRHLQMVLALSAVGYLIAVVFGLELAPDVSLVQVHVETLVTVLFVLALVLIPRGLRGESFEPPRERVSWWKITVALISGLGAAWLSWVAIEYRPPDAIGPWFNEHAPDLVHADDIVTAILVHFRALDTLGEITVFATAALGVLAIVRLIRGQSS